MKNRNVRFTTEVGTAKWPHLNKPDTKFNKEGDYKVSLVLDEEGAKKIQSEMRTVLDEFIAKMSPLPVRDEVDDSGNPTGNSEIKFKLKAVGGGRGGETWQQRPILIDAKRKPMTETIGGGSKIRIGCEIVPYSTAATGTGITLRLKAVQVIELVEISNGGSIESWSFNQEDGFTTSGKPSQDSEEGSEPEEGNFDW